MQRAAVRDSASGRVGSAGQFVEVPDLKAGSLALLGLIVNGTDSGESTLPAPVKGSASSTDSENVREGEYGTGGGSTADTGPALRRFRRGALVGYGLYVYGARLDSATQRPRLTTELRLFRDGKPVFAGKPLAFDASGQADASRLVAGGSFRLGTDLPPGDYVLQMVITDSLAEESR
jgi:hypothetical protein